MLSTNNPRLIKNPCADSVTSICFHCCAIEGYKHISEYNNVKGLYDIYEVCNACGHKSFLCRKSKDLLEPTLLEYRKTQTLSYRMEAYRDMREIAFEKDSHILIMLDGCCFSKYTKQFKQPFDDVFIEDMNKTLEYLVKNVPNCKMGYVQSDEISLYITYRNEPIESSCWRGNRYNKLISLIAGMASSKFTALQASRGIDLEKCALPYFDCKAWSVPNTYDVYGWFLHRQHDCVRNSVLQYAQSLLAYKDIHGLTIDAIKIKLKSELNIDWECLDNRKKYGLTYLSQTENKPIFLSELLINEHKDKIISELVKYS